MELVDADFARQLERELAEKTNEVDRFQAENARLCNLITMAINWIDSRGFPLAAKQLKKQFNKKSK
jgi:hypothetical protein